MNNTIQNYHESLFRNLSKYLKYLWQDIRTFKAYSLFNRVVNHSLLFNELRLWGLLLIAEGAHRVSS